MVARRTGQARWPVLPKSGWQVRQKESWSKPSSFSQVLLQGLHQPSCVVMQVCRSPSRWMPGAHNKSHAATTEAPQLSPVRAHILLRKCVEFTKWGRRGVVGWPLLWHGRGCSVSRCLGRLCGRWGREAVMTLLCDKGWSLSQLSLPHLPALGKHSVKLCHQGRDCYRDRNCRRYLYKIVCCVESVETRPPFLWVSCQSPEIAFRARTFPLRCFSLYINLGLGGMILLPSCLSHPQFITILLYPLAFFHLFKLGRKTGQEERGRGRGQAFNWEGSCFIVCCWQLPAFLEHIQIPLPNADWYRKFHFVLLPNSISIMDFVILLYLFPVLSPPQTPLK